MNAGSLRFFSDAASIALVIALAGCVADPSALPDTGGTTSELCAAPTALVGVIETPNGPRLTAAVLVRDQIAPEMERTALDPSRLARILDRNGNELLSFALPHDELRSVAHAGEEGEETSLAGAQASTVLVPWPEGAAGIVLDGGSMVRPACPARVTKADGTALEASALVSHGPSDNRFDLVILGDGYREQDAEKFATDAQRVADALLATEPYKTYADLVNVWSVYSASNLEGAGSDGTGQDTFYGCFFGGMGIPRVILCDAMKVRRTVLDTVPNADATLVMVNDSRYGGMNTPHYAALSNGPDLPSVLVHELGHRLNLGDEYTYTDYIPNRFNWANCADDANMTQWEYWRQQDMSVGAFGGCGLERQYRPTERSCIMLSSSNREFCPVCRENLVIELHTISGGLRGDSTPNSAEIVRLTQGQPTTFSVSLPQGTEERSLIDGYEYEWLLNGQRLEHTEATYTLETCMNGTLELGVRHRTDWVRPDYQSRLTRRVLWRFTCP